MSHKLSAHFKRDLEQKLSTLEALIAKTEDDPDFTRAYNAIDTNDTGGRTYREIVFDNLLDAYIDMTISLPPDRVPLEPYRMMLEFRNEADCDSEEARAEFDGDRDEQDDIPLDHNEPEFIKILRGKFCTEVNAITNAWKDAVICLANVMQSDQSYVVQTRVESYLQGSFPEPEQDDDSNSYSVGELNRMYEEALNLDLPTQVMTRIRRDLKRMDGMQPTSADYNSMMNPLLTILDLPWNKRSEQMQDIRTAEKRLDERLYGLEKVKRKIAEHIAAQKRAGKSTGEIICFNGAPGVGKTALGEAIAYATGRKFARIALGGARDVVDIRGHSSTYINSQAGRILRALIETGTKNPVIQLDEIDKIHDSDDVAAALLEVLDPAQNVRFHDTFADVDFDLSEVLFVASCNDKSRIMDALRDRMKFFDLRAYSAAQKFQIARHHLLPRSMGKTGLTGNDLALSDDALHLIISDYVREPGVRGLERRIADICMKSAYQLETGKADSILVNPKNLHAFLGQPPRRRITLVSENTIGVVNGLFVQGSVGSVGSFEALACPSDDGKFSIRATGLMGETMKESVSLVESWIKAHAGEYGIEQKELQKIHLHVDAANDGPKDGPSAGIALLTACMSALKKQPAPATLAMTGKLSLTGRVLAIGGTLEKLEGAMRDGMTKVLIPQANADDLADMSADIRAALDIITVDHVSEVLKIALPVKQLQLAYEPASVEVNHEVHPAPRTSPSRPSAPPAPA